MAVTQAQKRRLKEQAGFRCAVPTCNATSPLQIHHIIHREEGGLDTDDNLICLCSNCHGRYHQGQIDRKAIINYKQRLIKISIVLAPHEYNYLESLFDGQQIELYNNNINLARRIERKGFIIITELGNGLFRLTLTTEGRNYIH
jgi:hypothetical protein